MRRLIQFIFAICFWVAANLAYAGWTEYTNVSYLDFDGDLKDEIIIKSRHGAGSGHYVEMLRIFKDEGDKLDLIFKIRTLDKYFYNEDEYDIISAVEFSDPDKEGFRNIVVRSEKLKHQGDTNSIIHQEALGKKLYKWDGNKFTLVTNR